MDAGDLYYVARKLRALAEQALGAGPGQVDSFPLYHQLVLGEVAESRGSTILEIATRLSLSQSMVSTAVAALRGQGLLVTENDATDRRKVRVMPSERLAAWIETRLRRDAEEVLEPALVGLPARDRKSVLRSLALLHDGFKRREGAT